MLVWVSRVMRALAHLPLEVTKVRIIKPTQTPSPFSLLGFRVQGWRFEIQGLGFDVEALAIRVTGLGGRSQDAVPPGCTWCTGVPCS